MDAGGEAVVKFKTGRCFCELSPESFLEGNDVVKKKKIALPCSDFKENTGSAKSHIFIM